MTLQVRPIHCHACSPFPRAKEWYLYAARAGLPIGVASHRSFVSLSTIARREGSDKSARAATIFIHNGAPQALVGSQAEAWRRSPQRRRGDGDADHQRWSLGARAGRGGVLVHIPPIRPRAGGQGPRYVPSATGAVLPFRWPSPCPVGT